jgi:hypothetical protein
MSRPSSATPPVTLPATAPTAEEVLPLLRAHRKSWADRFHLRRIGLFGSVVRGEATESSVPWSGVTQEEQPRRSRG